MNTIKLQINNTDDAELKRLFDEVERMNNERDCTLINGNHKYKTLLEHYEFNVVFLSSKQDKIRAEIEFNIPHFLQLDLNDIKYLMLAKYHQTTGDYGSIYNVNNMKYDIQEMKMSYNEYLHLINQMHKQFPMIIDDAEFESLNNIEMFKTLFI